MVLQRIKDFFLNKLYYPLLELPLLQRLMCVWFGILGGIFPVPALTSGATAVLSALLGFSPAQSAIAIAVNLLMTPFQFMCMPLFADASLLFISSSSLSSSRGEGAADRRPSEIIFEAFKGGDVVAALQSIPMVILAACIPWVVVTIVSLIVFKVLMRGEEDRRRAR